MIVFGVNFVPKFCETNYFKSVETLSKAVPLLFFCLKSTHFSTNMS